MKKIIVNLVLFSTLSLGFISCDFIKENLTADVEVKAPDIDFTIGEGALAQANGSSNAPVAVITILDRVVDIDLEQKLKDAGYKTSDLKELTLKESTLRVVGDPIDLSVLQSMKLYLNDNSKLVASVKSIDNDTQEIKLKIENGDVLDDLLGDKSFRVILTCDVVPNIANVMKLSNVFTAKVAFVKD